jgi:hypothetical protein
VKRGILTRDEGATLLRHFGMPMTRASKVDVGERRGPDQERLKL